MFLRRAAWLTLLTISLCTGYVQAETVLPAPIPGVTSLQFGDFQVYSLALLNFAATGGTNFSSSDPYYVGSSPGAIVTPPDAIIATGPPGNADNQTNNVDDAFLVPNDGGSSTNNAFYSFSSGDEPTPNSFTGDQAGTWDANLATLLGPTFLNGAPLVFFFNLNETGTASQLAGQDMLVYVKVDLVDSTGTNATQTFYLRGGVGNTTLPGQSYSNTYHTDWAYVHSEITVDPATGAFIHLGPATDADKLLGYKSITQNLGADQAAFAAYSSALDTAARSGKYDTLRVDLDMGDINNGYEQLFIRAATIGGPVQVVPEPTTVGIWMGLSMIGLACNRFRNRLR